jgi:hypothetical protein
MRTTAIGPTAMGIGTTAIGPTSMDPPAAIPAEFTAGTATESHLTADFCGVTAKVLCSGLSVSEAKSMRTVVFSTAVIAGVVWIGMVPANAAPPQCQE